MLDREKFKETLESVSDIIRTAPEPMSEEEILGYFADMNLNEEQKAMVFTYLTTSHEEEKIKEVEQENEFVSEDAIESPVLRMYLEELQDLRTYSQAEEDALYEKLISGDDTTIKELADCWLGRVLELAKKHKDTKATLEDIIQEGNMGLFLELQELLGSGLKTDYRSLLSDSIEKSMWEFIVESGEVVEEGNSVVGKMSLIQEAKKILEEQEGRPVTTQELADYTKMEKEELEGILELIEKANRP